MRIAELLVRDRTVARRKLAVLFTGIILHTASRLLIVCAIWRNMSLVIVDTHN